MLNRFIKNTIIRDTFVVVLTWWIVLTVLDILDNGFDADAIGIIVGMLQTTLVGIAIGMGFSIITIYTYKKDQKDRLEGRTTRGVACSLGVVPRLLPPPARVNVLPETLPYPAEVPGKLIDSWKIRFQESHPEHVALMNALLCVYARWADLPATHMEGGHGGRSLFQHTLLVTGVSIDLAETWFYDGLKGKSGKIVVPLRNPGYRFDSADPMVAIIGIAHDIGKIESYLRDESGVITGCRQNHDQVGGRMLARLDEVWALPDEDRVALISVVSFYHRPMDLPTDAGGTPTDDRTIALMELLIKADMTASRLESGQTLTESEECDAGPPVDARRRIWEAFLDIMAQSGRINGPNQKYRIGQKNCDETGRAIVYLHEASMRETLARHLNQDGSTKLGDGTYVLTRALLKVLDEKGILYTQHEGAVYSDVRAIFMVEFSDRRGEHLANWPATIIIVPGTVIPSIANLPDFGSVPRIDRARFGERSAKSKKTIIDTAQEAKTESAMFELAPSRKKKPGAAQAVSALSVSAEGEIDPATNTEDDNSGAPPADDIPAIGEPEPDNEGIIESVVPVADGIDENDIPDPSLPSNESAGTWDPPEAPDDVPNPSSMPPAEEPPRQANSVDISAPPAPPAAAQDVATVPPPQRSEMNIVVEALVPRDEPIPTKATNRVEAIVQDLLDRAKTGSLQSAPIPDGRIVVTWDRVRETDPKLNWKGFEAVVRTGVVERVTFATVNGTTVLLIR